MNRKLALIASTVLAGGIMAAPALADVDVFATVDKDKVISVTENISITKFVTVNVEFITTFEGLSEADALVNATTSGHTVLLSLGGSLPNDGPNDDFRKRVANITTSIVGNTGVILQVNEAVGDNVNQGNVVSGSFTDLPAGPDPAAIQSVVTWSEAFVDQKSTNNTVKMAATLPGVPGPGGRPIPRDPLNPTVFSDFHIRAALDRSVTGNTGVIHVNQNAGTNTNQHNVLAFAVGLSSGLALGEAGLGQENSGNDVEDFNTYKSAQILASVNTNTGVVGVNQNSGHNNNQAAVINIAATTAATTLVPTP